MSAAPPFWVPFAAWLRPLLWFLLAYLLVHAMVLALRAWVHWRYQLRSNAHYIAASSGGRNPLPSQEAVIDRLLSEIAHARMDRANAVLAIEGRWGSGKSFVVSTVRSRLESNFVDVQSRAVPGTCQWGRVACVHLDVWREQSESDLHLELVETILSHPKVLEHGFTRYPWMRMVLRRFGHAFRHLFSSGMKLQYQGIEAQLGVSPQLLPMMAQNDLEKVLGELRLRKVLLVVVLDELDRAVPAVSQAAVVLTQRALALPGVVVLMPFVRSQFRQKVFNPAMASSADLYATFLAQLADHRQRQAFLASQEASTTLRPSVGLWRPTQELMPFLVPGTANSGDDLPAERKKVTEPASSKALASLSSWRGARWLGQEDELLEYLEKMHPLDREIFFEQAEEKYLSERVKLPGVTVEDVVQLLRLPHFASALPESVREAFRARDSGLLRKFEDELQGDIAEYLVQQRRGPAKVQYERAPTVRHFLGRMRQQFDALTLEKAVHQSAKDLSAEVGNEWEVVKAMVVVAWLEAQVASGD